MYSRDEIKALTDKVLNMAKADAVEMNVDGGERSTTRWVNSSITVSMVQYDQQLNYLAPMARHLPRLGTNGLRHRRNHFCVLCGLDGFPEDVSKRLPRYPATLLGRLATSLACRGRRLGERLLVDALHRSPTASTSVASVAVVVDAKDEGGATFHANYGFTRFVDSPLRPFMTMKAIATSWP